MSADAADVLLGLLDHDAGQGSRYHYCSHLNDRHCRHGEMSEGPDIRPANVPEGTTPDLMEPFNYWFWDRGPCPLYKSWKSQKSCPMAAPSRDTA